MADVMADLRSLNDRRDRRLRGHADPNCGQCRGRGQTKNHVAGDKYTDQPCPCTGFAAWQAGPCPEIPEPEPIDA